MAILATFFSTGFPPHGFDSVAGFGGAAGPGLGARAGGGLAGAVASLGLPGGTGFSLSAGGGVGIRFCLGGAVVGCALSARCEGARWGGGRTAGGLPPHGRRPVHGVPGFGSVGPLGAVAGAGIRACAWAGAGTGA